MRNPIGFQLLSNLDLISARMNLDEKEKAVGAGGDARASMAGRDACPTIAACPTA